MAWQLTEADEFAPFVASYFAATALYYAAATVAGGWLFDLLAERSPFIFACLAFDHFQLLFVGSWVARTAAVCWLWGVREDRRA